MRPALYGTDYTCLYSVSNARSSSRLVRSSASTALTRSTAAPGSGGSWPLLLPLLAAGPLPASPLLPLVVVGGGPGRTASIVYDARLNLRGRAGRTQPEGCQRVRRLASGSLISIEVLAVGDYC